MTRTTLIPNFSWTPRMIMMPDRIGELLLHDFKDGRTVAAADTSIILVPIALLHICCWLVGFATMRKAAVHGRVLRLFQHQGTWYIASNQRLEALPKDSESPTTSFLGILFENCLARYYARSVHHFTQNHDENS